MSETTAKPALNEYGPLARVALMDPAIAFHSKARIEAQWRDLNWTAAPDFAKAVREYDAFAENLAACGAGIVFVGGEGDDSGGNDSASGLTLDSLYIRDPLVQSAAGLIAAAMGKPARRHEPHAAALSLRAAGVAVCGAIAPPGLVEGGDLVWLDHKTLLAGRGYRSNDKGLRQLAGLAPGVTLEVFDLAHWHGPQSVFHLMSVLSPLDRDLALAFPPLMPARLVALLHDRGIRLIEVEEDEFRDLGCNVLALGPRTCLMVDGHPQTRKALEKAGVAVTVFAGDEICRKGEGGPTCLTRPLARAG